MDLMKYSKPFALAAILALVAGCGGGAATQPGDEDEVTADEVHVSDDAEAAAAGDEDAARAEAMEDEAAARDAVQRPEVMTIYFDFDKSNIRSEFYDDLNAHAAYLQANPDARVVLEGHTDERGTREYNMALGERRGNSVQRYLSLQGVSGDQMEVVSYGEERPVVRNAQTREDHAKNRRVEFIY
ncbi:peptidoglycan-associated lipoprotein [Marinospirillum celere]|uniref:Peptidoglycan-associated lipoprotein n=1 Tax=Marinospirillum celere TaxID=1122252 RepID=A0A1I1ESE6_9GAMM|nr:peptidoglycan-associated lipoprotein Pal [Marinospirillum celere]SFB90045.1 peptidoglycan-associated lipoprotein [Marinospirillum celere]